MAEALSPAPAMTPTCGQPGRNQVWKNEGGRVRPRHAQQARRRAGRRVGSQEHGGCWLGHPTCSMGCPVSEVFLVTLEKVSVRWEPAGGGAGKSARLERGVSVTQQHLSRPLGSSSACQAGGRPPPPHPRLLPHPLGRWRRMAPPSRTVRRLPRTRGGAAAAAWRAAAPLRGRGRWACKGWSGRGHGLGITPGNASLPPPPPARQTHLLIPHSSTVHTSASASVAAAARGPWDRPASARPACAHRQRGKA